MRIVPKITNDLAQRYVRPITGVVRTDHDILVLLSGIFETLHRNCATSPWIKTVEHRKFAFPSVSSGQIQSVGLRLIARACNSIDNNTADELLFCLLGISNRGA